MDLSYPIGKFDSKTAVTAQTRPALIAQIAEAPIKFREAVHGLDDSQLDTPYRPGGWTPRQVIHHLADSHMNSFVRIRLALTEDSPTINAYDEKQWAELKDSRLPVEVSLQLLDSLHVRWVTMLESLTDADFTRTFIHPEKGPLTLNTVLALYAWHGRHHTAHITGLRERMGWK
jgi:uncharacterized damage-inducible protein DinB